MSEPENEQDSVVTLIHTGTGAQLNKRLYRETKGGEAKTSEGKGETTWSKFRLIESRAAGEDGETEEAAGVEVPVSGVIVTVFSFWSRLSLRQPSTILTSDAAYAQWTK